MEPISKILILTISLSVMIIFSSAEGERSKLRSITVVLNEVNAIKEVLANSSDDGSLQWEPSHKTKFALMDRKDIPLGLKEDSKTRGFFPKRAPSNRRPPVKPGESRFQSGTIKLPRRYNAREVWGQKCPSFNHILDQGHCSNCWATAIIAMLNDRICMYQKEGEPQKYYSIKHLTTCARDGCVNGAVQDGLDSWIDRNQGLVTGGDSKMRQQPGCKAAPWDLTVLKNTPCTQICDNFRPISENDKSIGAARYEIRSRRVEEIMTEIYLYGPVIATMEAYQGFTYYSGGIYKFAGTNKLGGHAVKLYGWGEENGIPFWYGANSWGTEKWGERGFFKIQRGSNECKIEEFVHAALPAEALF